MATISKQKSRRRLAAVNFLSNISLDGQTNGRDAKFVQLINPPDDNGVDDKEAVLEFGCGRDDKKRFLSEKKIRTDQFRSSKESQKGPQVRFIKSLKEHRDERIVFLSLKRNPFAIFSTLPYNDSSLYCQNRDSKQEHTTRRKNTKPVNPGTVASDPYDLLSLMGFERTNDGQETSFSDLLAPSNHFQNNRFKTIPTGHENLENFHTNITKSSNEQYPVLFPKQHYAHYLQHQMSAPLEYTENKDEHERHNYLNHSHHIYHPNLLDDPELIAGKHSTLLAFPSYITSIIDYVKPSDLKKELNEKFKERFPNIQLSLSKMKSLKNEMFKIATVECSIDFLTVAQAYVYFEKLILRILINKQNRKLCAGACLILSAKLNDVKGSDLRNLIEKIEIGFRVNQKELLSMELGVLVALEFSLYLPIWQLLPIYQRLMYET